MSSDAPRSELTLRGLVIGILITLVFTAANVYFGLEAGLTFATSIPAAVISMAVLRKFSDATIQENNIVQTIASAAGTLSAIIFVLPGLVIVGWWSGFPYWETMLICALGGILGVMYSIPLRRALVTNSILPYPEGVACAEVLKVGASHRADVAAGNDAEGAQAGFRAVIWGSLVSASFAIVIATHIFAKDVSAYFRFGDRGSATGFDFSRRAVQTLCSGRSTTQPGDPAIEHGADEDEGDAANPYRRRTETVAHQRHRCRATGKHHDRRDDHADDALPHDQP